MNWYTQPDPEALAGELFETFAAAYGDQPAGVWTAPGRVNVIGEHVDYNAGLCLPFALPQSAFAAVALRSDGLVRVRSVQLPDQSWSGRITDVGPGTVPGWAGYPAGVAWALAQRFPQAGGGFDAALSGHVPLGSGLSSSAALECSLVIALDELLHLGLGDTDSGRSELAAICKRAENEIVGAPTGGLDQSASLRCRSAYALLLDCRDGSGRQIPFDLAAAGLELLVIDTRAHHRLADGQYALRRADCERAVLALGLSSLREISPGELAATLDKLSGLISPTEDAERVGRRVRHVVSEIARVEEFVALLDAGRVRDSGPALDASHDSLRLDYDVSCPELDLAVDVARAAGALGARMTGGGFGGSAIALVDHQLTEGVAQSVADAFETAGFGAPAFLRALPSAPARRVL